MAQTIATTGDVLDYYRQQSPFTDPGIYAWLYDALPEALPGLCRTLQNTILHMFWIGEETYGVTYDELRATGRQICVEFSCSSAEERLASIQSLDARPLVEFRGPASRSVGCCRDYALMLVSILRHRGIAARVRTGVARYFFPGGHLEDHYICESWDASAGRWQQTDAQIDEVQRKAAGLELETADLPANQFLNGWQTYEEVRTGRVEPENIGFPPVNCGLTYGRNKLFADFVSVTGHEVPVHGWWGIGDPKDASQPGDDDLIEHMIKTLRGIDGNDPAALEEALDLTANHPRLRMPEGYTAGIYRSKLC